MRVLLESNLPPATLAWLVGAFLVEVILYVMPASGRLRSKLAGWPQGALGVALTASAAIPYLIYALPSGCFALPALVAVVGLAGAVSFWYVFLPRCRLADLAFVSLVAAVALSRIWHQIYKSPLEEVPLEALGQLMWIRLGLISALVLRRVEGTGFGWWPTRREWKLGLVHFLAFLPCGAALGRLTGLLSLEVKAPEGWTALVAVAATFAGMFWVVALSEEFFFRGLLQGWLREWLGSRIGALIVASLAFGLAHLPFRGFPNWRFALVATAAGLFYGRAYMAGGGIRAAMVAHALTNTVWRLFVR